MVTLLDNCALGASTAITGRGRPLPVELAATALQPKAVAQGGAARPSEIAATSLGQSAHPPTAPAKVVRQYSK